MAINIDEVFSIISTIKNQKTSVALNIEEALNSVIAENIYASSSLPKFNNSAMDGYAIKFQDKDKNLKVIDTVLAGDNKETFIEDNSCVKIMTGAKIPSNADAIVPKEDILEIDSTQIKIAKNVNKYQHIRFIGEDIKEGELLIEKGTFLDFSHLALLSSQGIDSIKVLQKAVVAVFSSGEELKPYYEKANKYQIYNSNTPTLIARLKDLSCEVLYTGQAKDSVESISSMIENSLHCDMIITTGGVSVGDADFTKEAINKFDFKCLFDGINIKPGKPTVFGKINDTYILNLPGNPFAAFAIFELFGKEIMQRLLGINKCNLNYFEVINKNAIDCKSNKTQIIAGNYDGKYFEVSTKNQAGMVSAISSSNCMIVIDKNCNTIKKDSYIKILPISWKFFTKEKKDFIIYE